MECKECISCNKKKRLHLSCSMCYRLICSVCPHDCLAKKIICPHCGKQHIDEEYDYISYHGDESHEIGCQDCGKDFLVNETVIRTYDTEKIE